MKDKGIKVVTADGQIVYVPPGGTVYLDGAAIPDPTPVEMPLGYEHPESLQSMIARLVHQVSAGQASIGEESLDDANDFDVDDDDVLEDTFTDSELHAILARPEMREQFLRDQEEKRRERQSGADSGDSGRREEDRYVGEVSGTDREVERVRERNRQRDSRGSARGNQRAERQRKNRDHEFAADSEDGAERDE